MHPVPEPISTANRISSWVHDHGHAVRGYLRGVMRGSAEAEDLFQEVFRRAWQARERYQEQGTPRAYLLKIADRLHCDYRRGALREVTLDPQSWEQIEPADRDMTPQRSLEQQELKQQLEQALTTLSEPQRRVLLLRYYGEFSFAEIAQTMQSPLNTVLSHAHRGLLALRKQFAGNTP